MNPTHPRSSIIALFVGTTLSATVLLTPSESQERKPSSTVPAKQDPVIPPGVAPTVAAALEELRRAVTEELAGMKALGEREIDESRVAMHVSGEDRLIAGAPVQSNAPGDVVQAGSDGDEPARALDDERVVGTVLLLGVLETSPTQPSERNPFSAGGTFLVRREAPGACEVAIVSAEDEVLAVVPIIDRTPTAATWNSDHARVAGDGGPGLDAPHRGSGESEWGRIYMSILHYFDPELD